ncbi:MAG: hypothetical protein RSB59_05020 [Clostridia bacterium]
MDITKNTNKIVPKQICEASIFKNAIDDYLDFHENEELIDLLEDLKDIENELKTYTKSCIQVVRGKIFDLKNIIINNDMCPMCGSALESIVDESLETYVPYGDTSVPLGTGYRTVCSSCGYEVED